MQIKLTINGVDFAPWVAEGGMSYSPIVRQSRSIVVLNGTDEVAVYYGYNHKRYMKAK